jgi:excisionase family DNA binding protein
MAHAHIPVVPLTNRRAYSLAEVAAVTGFSLSFIYELIKSGTLRSRKVAGRRIVSAEALAELLGETLDAALLPPPISNATMPPLSGDAPPPLRADDTAHDHDQPRRDNGNRPRARTMRPTRRRARESVDA